ncbi:hypothetical protein, partial [Immundisolibacter sp.]
HITEETEAEIKKSPFAQILDFEKKSTSNAIDGFGARSNFRFIDETKLRLRALLKMVGDEPGSVMMSAGSVRNFDKFIGLMPADILLPGLGLNSAGAIQARWRNSDRGIITVEFREIGGAVFSLLIRDEFNRARFSAVNGRFLKTEEAASNLVALVKPEYWRG